MQWNVVLYSELSINHQHLNEEFNAANFLTFTVRSYVADQISMIIIPLEDFDLNSEYVGS